MIFTRKDYKMNKTYFYELLDKAVSNNISEDEKDELWKHLTLCESADMKFIQYACCKNYIPAYSSLANIYAQGKLCPQDWNKAIECWEKIAAEANEDYLWLSECYIKLGDCYRLGNGVEKNFDTAYNYYQLSIENEQERERGELPGPRQILLLDYCGDDMIERMAVQGVSVEWVEYAISRLEQPVSGIIYRAMANAYPWGGEKCLYWMQRAADTGDLTAKQIVETELIPTKINETLNSNDCLSEDNFMDEDFEDDDCDDEYIECRCCHHRFLRDEVEDPETDICNDCLYSGNEFAQD